MMALALSLTQGGYGALEPGEGPVVLNALYEIRAWLKVRAFTHTAIDICLSVM